MNRKLKSWRKRKKPYRSRSKTRKSPRTRSVLKRLTSSNTRPTISTTSWDPSMKPTNDLCRCYWSTKRKSPVHKGSLLCTVTRVLEYIIIELWETTLTTVLQLTNTDSDLPTVNVQRASNPEFLFRSLLHEQSYIICQAKMFPESPFKPAQLWTNTIFRAARRASGRWSLRGKWVRPKEVSEKDGRNGSGS